MTHGTLAPHVKPPEIASRDRDIGSAFVFVVFGVAIVVLVLALRRIRARALVERADRELRDEIDDVTKEMR